LIAVPFVGYLIDYFIFRRTSFIITLLVLSTSIVLLYIGSSITIFILGRTSRIILVIKIVGKDKVGRTIGIYSLGLNLAILLAPLIEGLIFEYSSYYLVFTIAFYFISLDIV
ncbi:uncharacterized protein A1O9_10598, partial [Exophiala aquamarina CBS 119918]